MNKSLIESYPQEKRTNLRNSELGSLRLADTQ